MALLFDRSCCDSPLKKRDADLLYSKSRVLKLLCFVRDYSQGLYITRAQIRSYNTFPLPPLLISFCLIPFPSFSPPPPSPSSFLSPPHTRDGIKGSSEQPSPPSREASEESATHPAPPNTSPVRESRPPKYRPNQKP